MSKRGRRSKPPKKKPKAKWSFHVSRRPSRKPNGSSEKITTVRRMGDAHSRKITVEKKATSPARKWSFNDPEKVAPVKKRDGPWWTATRDRYAELPGTGVRHEVPLEEEWDCKYDCKPFVWLHGQLHGHACPYWNNEGVSRTPF